MERPAGQAWRARGHVLGGAADLEDEKVQGRGDGEPAGLPLPRGPQT